MGSLASAPNPQAAQSEWRFAAFANAIPTLAWMANADGYITWYNQRWYDYTGATPEQMEGWGWQSVHDPDMLPSVMDRWKVSIETGEPFQMVFPLRGVDGVFRSFLTLISPFRDQSGAIAQWFGINTEVDELQRTREALEASEQELRYTLELNPQIPWSADAAGRFLDFGPRWLEITGLTREEALNQGWLQVTHPDDRSMLDRQSRHALQTGEPLDLEHRIRDTQGQYLWVRSRAYPRRDEHGRIIKWYGTTENIDEQKKSQEVLRQSEERLRLAFAVSGMGTWDWDLPANRVYFDSHLVGIFGMDPKIVSSGFPIEDFYSVLHPDDLARVEKAVAHTLGTGEDYAADYRVIQADDSIRWISARGSCTLGVDGKPLRFLGVCLDITERKLTEQALIQNEKLAAVGRMAASISHEINNPLDSVTNLIYLARSSTVPADIQDYLQTAEQELRRVSAISGQTLRFHRQSTRPTLVSCDDLIGTVLSIYQGRLRNYPIEIEKRKRAVRPVLCLEGEIRQVLSNLIGNAIDALAPHSGKILLRSREGTSWSKSTKGLFITVADTGPGMSPSTARRVFEPFYTTKENLGTGLGLWISREIVSRHNGTLRFRSSQRKPHSGTVFTLFLPFEPPVRS